MLAMTQVARAARNIFNNAIVLPPAAEAALRAANDRFQLVNNAGGGRSAEPSIEDLEQIIAAHRKVKNAIRDDAEGRALTEREERRIAEADEAIACAQVDLEARSAAPTDVARTAVRNAGAAAGPGRRTNPELLASDALDAIPKGSPRMGVLLAGARSPARTLFGSQRDQWKSADDFFRAVRSGVNDPRLFSNSTGVEGVGVDGGFDVPPGFYQGMLDMALQQAEFAPRCRVFASPGNSLIIPIPDMRNRTGGTLAGITANWAGENEQQTPQSLKWIAREVKLNKTFILAEGSSELIEDGANYAQQLETAMAETTALKLDAAIFIGNGMRMPLGLLTGSTTSAIQVAAEGGQTAATVLYLNLVKLYSRLVPACQKRATWFISSDVMPQLLEMVFPGSTNPVLINALNAGATGAVNMTIFGRPVVVTEIASLVGDPGDILFADMTQYALLLKGGARLERSNAPGFDRDVWSWRLILRVGGLPLWDAPITPYNGGPTLSWAAYLAARH